MPHAQALERVREIVRSAFAAQGLTETDEFSESILIRDGYYCGRSFSCSGMRAVWFIEENLLKFFGRNQQLVSSQRALDESSSESMVA
jgi:hypothetical protein